MSTPLGERKASLSLKNSGGTLTGTQGVEGSSSEIFDGRTSGDDVAWKVSIKNPMPLTLAFSGKVSGDSMSGELGIGPMGAFRFREQRCRTASGQGGGRLKLARCDQIQRGPPMSAIKGRPEMADARPNRRS